jgi:hypothetical protein
MLFSFRTCKTSTQFCSSLYLFDVVSSLQHLSDLGDLVVAMGITGGGIVIPLSGVKTVWKGGATERALDMSLSPHLTIGHLNSCYKGDE